MQVHGGPSKRSGLHPSKSANVKNPKQYEALKDKGMSKQRAARIANSPDASKLMMRTVAGPMQQRSGIIDGAVC
jgi:hypothetical protein